MRSVRLTRGRASAATAAIAGITSAVAVFALDPAVNAASSENWATGVAANGTVLNTDTPHVTSNGSLVDKSLASVPSNPALTAQLLHVTATGDSARASLVDLNLGSGQITASIVEATCQGGAGDSKLVHAVIGGQQVPVAVPPNTTIAVPPQDPTIAKVILNKQVPDGNGGTEVTGIEVSVKLPSTPVAQTVDISTADCSAASTGTGSTPPSAPAPNPKQGTLPVTG